MVDEYFTKKYERIPFDGEVNVKVAPDGVAAYSIYPVYDWDGEKYIMRGDPEKIFPIASKHKAYVAVQDIL